MPRCIARTTCTRHDACGLDCYARKRCNNNSLQNNDTCCCHRSQEGDTSTDRQCPICIDGILRSHNSVTLIGCGNGTSQQHTFHKTCLGSWIKSGKDTCPICRERIPKDIILRLDPNFYKRMENKGPVSFVVPGVAHFTVPRPNGMTDRELYTRILDTVAVALASSVDL